MAKKRIDTSLYVDFSALNEWRLQLDKINESALCSLNDYSTILGELNNYWTGDSADSFFESAELLLDKAKDYHKNMKIIDNIFVTLDLMDK